MIEEVTLTDTVKNTVFGYLYVKHFKWIYPDDNENHQGHPKSGRLYRGIMNTDTNSYRLFYGDKPVTGVFLPTLVGKDTDENNMYESEIIPLNRSTILDCDITSEDLDSLLEWIEEDNQTLREITNLVIPPTTGEEIKKAFMRENATQADIEFVEFIKVCKKLKDLNPILFDGTAHVIHFLTEVNEDTPSSWLERSKLTGPGKNIGDAVEHLQVYGGSDRRTNLNELDLLLAIKSLLTELTRNSIQNNE